METFMATGSAAHRIAVIPGDGIGKEVMPEGVRVLEAVGRKFGIRYDWHEYDWNCDYYPAARPDDAGGLVRNADAVGCDLLRRCRLARDRARSRVALGIADPVSPPLRPVRQPAALPADAGHCDAARESQARRHRLCRRAREHRGRILVGRRPMYEGTPREIVFQESVFSRQGVDRILKFAFELAQTRADRHLTSATKSNGISITMPYWDERFRAMAAQYPGVRTDQYHIDILSAHFVLNPDRFDVVVGSNLFGDILSDLGPAVCGTIGIAPSGNINPERAYPSLFEPVHGSASGHRRQGHRQSDRPDLVGRADARAPGREQRGRRDRARDRVGALRPESAAHAGHGRAREHGRSRQRRSLRRCDGALALALAVPRAVGLWHDSARIDTPRTIGRRGEGTRGFLMLIGIPRETRTGETRVAATPETVKKIAASGKHEIVV
jgi:tartrate dehydrogenase/decarboxylase/D-malate dehydrogenase